MSESWTPHIGDRVRPRVRMDTNIDVTIGRIGYVFQDWAGIVSVSWDDGWTDKWHVDDLELVESAPETTTPGQ